MTHPPLIPVGSEVRVTAGWWLVHGLPEVATVTRHLGNDRLFPYSITIGDGREWAMAARELVRCE